VNIIVTEDREVRTIVTTKYGTSDEVERTVLADVSDLDELVECGTRRQVRRYRVDALRVRFRNGNLHSFTLSGRRVLKSGTQSPVRESEEFAPNGARFYSWERIHPDAPAEIVAWVKGLSMVKGPAL
jgi:hypothetical protein